jgi:nicotinate phosphoribosyltransferase
VRGPILQAQLLETALLNIINFQTLIATKAARVCLATEGDPVLEFGLRRAQGVDGALAASRAAYIGGCAATSNVQAGQYYGIPVKGTHAHSWVMSFDSEEEAFSRYAGSMPNNCVFLVDTYDSVEGVRNAVRVARGLREKGHEMVGIRLDSGDLAGLSIKARKILDEAGFPEARIFASNDLDEHIIRRLKTGGARIDVWGVGTRLVTAFDQPAMGGVYKLAAIRDAHGTLRHRLKLSEQIIKISNPGVQQVRRFSAGDLFVGDMIFNEADPLEDDRLTIDPNNPGRKKRFDECSNAEDLLVPVFRTGSFVYESPAIANIRARTFEQIKKLHPGVTRFSNPLEYPVGLEPALHQLRERLIRRAREKGNKAVMR